MSFDERADDLVVNSSSLGHDLTELRARDLLVIDHVQLDPQMLIEAGDYDLEGLFVRLDHAVRQVNARRVVLDSIDSLFAGVPDEAILRAELRRLFAWLKDRDLTTLITAERGPGGLTRHGIEEYVSDCVILLDQRVDDEIATRRLRIVKYRGSGHGGNEFPFLIDDDGIAVLPVTSLGLEHQVSRERVSTGVEGLDAMLGGEGFYRGSSVLLSGGPGTGKTSIGAHFAAAACRRGEQAVIFSFEESEPQLVRNMGTIGIDLQTPIQDGLLTVQALRPTSQGLEMHLARMLHLVQSVRPSVAVVDPLSALQASGTGGQSRSMVLRLIDYIKSLGITALYHSIDRDEDTTDVDISSLTDTWIALENIRGEADLARRVFVVKSRGMDHSADVRKLAIGSDGLKVDVREAGA